MKGANGGFRGRKREFRERKSQRFKMIYEKFKSKGKENP